MLQIRRYNDIVAFRREENAPMAFHARNLELAEVSEEVWNSLAETNFLSSAKGQLYSQDLEASEELAQWEMSDVLESSGSLSFGIRSLTINVTQICNLHCTYCAAGGDGSYGDAVKKISIEKTLPQIKFFMEQLPNDASFHIAFLGGEPLLYPEALKAIADHAKEQAKTKNISVSFKVTTNGTLLTEKNIEILNDIGLHVVVSLDGPADINDVRRPSKAGRPSTEKILEGLQRLAALRKNISCLELHSVMDPQHHDVEKTYNFFSSLPVDRFEFTYSVSDNDLVSSQSFVESYERATAMAWARGGEKELRRFSLFDRYFNILDSQQRVENHCGLGKTLAVVDARNRLFNCPWTVGDQGHQIGEGQVLDYDRLEKHSQNLVTANKCQDCWARFLCGGGCSFVHESIDGVNLKKKKDFCFRTRYLTALVLAYFQLIRGETPESEGLCTSTSA